MLINDGNRVLTLTTASGTASYTYENVKNRRLVQLSIVPTSSNTSYDISIIDTDNIAIFDENWTGSRNWYSASLPEYIYSNFTVTIANASADEAFTVKLVFSEETT